MKISVAWLVALLALAFVAPGQAPAYAQTSTAQTKHKLDPYGSPLDTIMSTRLWTDVPQAQDFVRDSRPAAKDLQYTPLTGKDPVRPKLRDAANIMALQAELEESGALNTERARPLHPTKSHRAPRRDP